MMVVMVMMMMVVAPVAAAVMVVMPPEETEMPAVPVTAMPVMMTVTDERDAVRRLGF